jgi:uncharacterized protein (UPF0335 family)
VSFRDRILSARQVKSDADSDLTLIYKEAKDEGLHVPALKMLIRLSMMKPTALDAWLENFDRYRAEFGLDNQGHLTFEAVDTDTAA